MEGRESRIALTIPGDIWSVDTVTNGHDRGEKEEGAEEKAVDEAIGSDGRSGKERTSEVTRLRVGRGNIPICKICPSGGEPHRIGEDVQT
jgi:hypothetical protein